jgi:hypothetical protein
MGQTGSSLRYGFEGAHGNVRMQAAPALVVRPTAVCASLLVGDAFGQGFGTTSWKQTEEEIIAQYGGWDEETSRKSSNFREAYNLLVWVEQMLE